MRYGSVCSGIEAATVAWHPLGWEPAFFSEIDAFPRKLLGDHYPGVPLHGDFTTIGADDYGSIDLLVGGTPCQSFSIAGLRGGMDDERGNLALEYLRLADRKRPRWLVWENVPGVLSSNGGRDFGAFLGGLAELRYGWAYRILDAQYFGVPQRRRRVFVVGYLGDWRPAAAVLFERHSLQGHPAPRRSERKRAPTSAKDGAGGRGVEPLNLYGGNKRKDRPEGGFYVEESPDASKTLDCATGLHPNSNQGGTAVVSVACHEVAPAVTVGPPFSRTGNERVEAEAMIPMGTAHTLRGEGFDASEDGTGRGTPLVPVYLPDTANTLTSRMSKGINTEVNEGQTPIAFTRCDDGRDASEDIAPTLRCGTHQSAQPAVAFQSTAGGGDAHAAGDDVSPSLRAADPMAVALQTANTNANGRGVSEETAYTLDSANGQAVAVHENNRNELREMEVFSSLTQGGGKPGQGKPTVRQGLSVRRLTPRECERLQGFPDDYTMISYRNKPAENCPDGPRYKALGNSMAVPVMRWIGQRIESVTKILEE